MSQTLALISNTSTTALNTTSAQAVGASWGVLPPLGNLDAYIHAVNRMPLLTQDQEQELARKLRDTDDIDAAGKLVMSHLRLVVAISRKYLGYGLAHSDLIQEGNVGLLKAVRRFNPDQGVRLVSYAMHWIRAEIHDYVLKNWRMVKVATTKAQRKLFFNLRSLKNELRAEALDQAYLEDLDDNHAWAFAAHDGLTEHEITQISKELGVKPEEVIEMQTRLSGGDVSLEPSSNDDEESFAPIAYLSDVRHEPTHALEANEQRHLESDGITQALQALDVRSRRIVQERWLKVNDDNSGGMTLQELAKEYGVSAERIRQIEAQAMKKMKKVLQSF